MAESYYQILFIVSFILSAVYVFIWNKHFDVDITAIFIIVPISNLGYLMYYQVMPDIKMLQMMVKLVYLAACYLTFFITMCILTICDIKIKNKIRTVCYVISSLLYISVLSVGHSNIFYKSMTVIEKNGGYSVSKEYGYMHSVLYFVLIIYTLIGITALFAGIKKSQVSNKIIILLFIPEVASIAGYFVNRYVADNVEIMPLISVLSQIMLLIIVYKMSMLSIGDTAVEAMVNNGDTGLISVDRNSNYLNSNETARTLFPILNKVKVETPISKIDTLGEMIESWIKNLETEKKDKNVVKFENDPSTDVDDEYYIASVKPLNNGNKLLGYQIYISDDTEGQKYLELVKNYNKQLEEEVIEKTKHIIDMHDKLILGMATMVESRDNSTGGHIRRTSKVVSLLVQQKNSLPESFKNKIIKAAPMHDIGKVTIDDAILRKPGKITDEEFEKMKSHTSEGARIIHEILKDTDDDEFKIIAENVAHYHHEKWDGSGYPKGLKGEGIPLEARIMAIADVYDALVSKRVYKESYSFEKVNEIILEGMGTQFDPDLKDMYERARGGIEDYYKGLERS